MVSEPVATTLGRYRLIAKLGTGGMADVFLAVLRGQRGFNKLVVLKVPRDHVAGDRDLLAMFLDEARLAARLNHPNVVQTFEVLREGERDVIVMEYLEGHTLNEILAEARKSGRPFPLWMHLHVIAEALSGLQYAHDAKNFDGTPLDLVHRDVSPHNVFVTFDGEVKLLDFGVAKAATSSHETAIGTFKGKVRYMPFEQLTGQKVDRRADIFAAGAMTWEALAGQKLWAGKNDVEVMSAIVAGDIPTPESVNVDASSELSRICMKALSHDQSKRHQTAAELRTEVEGYIATLPDRKDKRALAATLNELFEVSREQRRKAIELQLSKADVLASVGDESDANAEPLALSSTNLPTFGSSATTPSGNSGTAEPRSLATTAATVTEKTPTPRRTRWLIGGGVLVAGAAAAAFLMSAGAPPEAPATAAASASPEIAEPAAAQEVAIVVRAIPSDAKVYFDGALLPANPATKRMPRDGVHHVIRAEADGYVERNVDLVLDGDKEIVVSLDKVDAPEPSATPVVVKPVEPKPAWGGKASKPAVTQPPVVHAPPPPTATNEKPASKTEPKRTPRSVDTANPWEN